METRDDHIDLSPLPTTLTLFALFSSMIVVTTAILFPFCHKIGSGNKGCLWLMVYSGGFMAELVKKERFRADRQLADFLEDIKKQNNCRLN